MQPYDVIVLGSGNAGLCAALSAREQGARVALLERAPKEQRGGNSAHTGGAFRVAYRGVDDLRSLMPDLLESEVESSDFGAYTQDDFFGELAAMSQYRTDPQVLDTVVSQSLDTLQWMTGKGVRFMPIYGRQAFKVDGKFRFWGGLTIEVSGGGLGLVDALFRRVKFSTTVGPNASAAILTACGNCPVRTVVSFPLGGWSSRRVASMPICNGAPNTWGRDGTWPKSAGHATTPATASAWPWMWAPWHTATGPVAMRCFMTSTPRKWAT